MIRWLAFLAALMVLALLMHNAPTTPVAAPSAPLGYFIGEYPKQAPAASWRTGRASWYGEPFRGRRTASGERFDPGQLTCAHKSLPFGTRLEVRYHGRTVQVRVSDRGPYVAGRVLDLSQGAFQRLAPLGSGVIQVEWRKL